MKLAGTHRSFAKTVQPPTWTQNFLATHTFLGFYKNDERVPRWRKIWPSRSDYTPHQGRKECAKRKYRGY